MSFDSREQARSDGVHSPLSVHVISRGLLVEGVYPRSHERVTASPASYTRFNACTSIPSVMGGRPHTAQRTSRVEDCKEDRRRCSQRSAAVAHLSCMLHLSMKQVAEAPAESGLKPFSRH